MKTLILVNGIPASGKSGTAKVISSHFSFPVLSIDEIKEPFMAQFSETIDRPLNRKLGYAAYEAMFNIVKASPDECTFIMDAWFGFRDKSILQNYLKVCNCQKVIEVWNSISPQKVAERYKSRCGDRVKGHPGEEYIPELVLLAQQAQPMQLGETFILNQNDAGSDSELISWLTDRLNHF